MEKIRNINISLVLLPVLLFSLGYVTHLSASLERAQNHLIFMLVGLMLFVLFSAIDYHFLFVVYKPFYFLVVLLLAFVYLFGETILGSSRWIDLGFITIQPSELAKLSIVLTTAFYLHTAKMSENVNRLLIGLFYYFVPIFLLILLQPDLGSAVIVLMCLVGMLFINGFDVRYFVFAFAIFGILSAPLWNLLHEYQKYRILVFFNPSLDTLGRGYNVIQSLIAIGSGGVWGKGFGMGTQNHLNFLPIYWTDFVAASFAEEWGFVGILIMCLLFFGLLLTIIHITLRVKDRLGKLIASGVLMTILPQIIINIGMNIGLLPVTGITLPLVSYGGSSIIVNMVMLGILHSVWVHDKNL